MTLILYVITYTKGSNMDNLNRLNYALRNARIYHLLGVIMNSEYYISMSRQSLRKARLIANEIRLNDDKTVEFKIKLVA